MRHRSMPLAARLCGVTLVELLVAITIGLIVVLAATNILISGEAQRRTTTGINDTSQSGGFAAYTLDRVLRSAGSGFSQAWDQSVFGCRLTVVKERAAILPRATPFPAPFEAFAGDRRDTLPVAPVLIGHKQAKGGSDVLMVMSGNGSSGDATRRIKSGVPSANSLRMENTIGLRDGDLGLVTQPGSTECLLDQVRSDATTLEAVGNEALPLGGTYLNDDAKRSAMAATGDAYFSTVGNARAGSGNSLAGDVQFQLFGVNAQRTLVAYDLLRGGATAKDADPVQPLADGVAELHAMYGIAKAGPPWDNLFQEWVAPTGEWDIAKVLADPAKMRQIVAVRIALVLRDANYEKQVVTTERPVLFADTTGAIAAIPYPEGSDDRHFRVRVIDTTVPLRNVLLLR